MGYHIRRDEIVELLRSYKRNSETQSRFNVRVNDHLDTIATLDVLEQAQTIVFDSEQALALVPAIRRFVDQLDFRLPFPAIWFQFSSPIPETDALAKERDEDDQIVGIAVSQHEDGGVTYNNASIWFESSAVNRALWRNDSATPLIIDPTAVETEAETSDILLADNLTPQELKNRNKEIIRLLACAMVAYINCENIEMENHAAPAKVNAKRLRKGKKPLPPYYTLKIRGVQYPGNGSAGTGRTVGHRFDVRGHFRRLENGAMTWVRPHQRGLQHTHYVPKVYEVQ